MKSGQRKYIYKLLKILPTVLGLTSVLLEMRLVVLKSYRGGHIARITIQTAVTQHGETKGGTLYITAAHLQQTDLQRIYVRRGRQVE